MQVIGRHFLIMNGIYIEVYDYNFKPVSIVFKPITNKEIETILIGSVRNIKNLLKKILKKSLGYNNILVAITIIDGQPIGLC